jgi:hypothetical protein
MTRRLKISTDAGRTTIAAAWSPTTRAFLLEGKKYHKYSGVNMARLYREKKNARIQNQLDDTKANADRTGCIDQMILFAGAQNGT